MQFYDDTRAQIEYMERRQKQLKDELKKMPRGRLVKKYGRGRVYYYEEINGKRVSLNKNVKRRKAYVRKNKVAAEIEVIEKNLQILRGMIKRYEPLLFDDEGWDGLKQEANPFMKENKKFIYNGIGYRSKSEVTIAQLLTSYNIDFKYETEYELNGRMVYPDFWVKRPRDGKIIAWEHAGRTDDEEYLHKSYKKMDEYHEDGLRLWDNFIITFDKEDGSLNVDYIDKVIKLYFL